MFLFLLSAYTVGIGGEGFILGITDRDRTREVLLLTRFSYGGEGTGFYTIYTGMDFRAYIDVHDKLLFYLKNGIFFNRRKEYEEVLHYGLVSGFGGRWDPVKDKLWVFLEFRLRLPFEEDISPDDLFNLGMEVSW